MKATRKSVARSTSAAALIAALVVPITVQAQTEQGTKAPATQAQPKKEQPSQPSPGTQGAKPPGNTPGVGRTSAPGTAAPKTAPPGTAPPGTAARGAPGTPGSTGANQPGASKGPGAVGTPAAPKTAKSPPNAGTPGQSAEAAIKREQLLERRRARTLEEYEKSYTQLNAPADGKKLSKKERNAIKRRMVSAERRIVALHRADEQSYRALTKEQREQIAARVKQRRETLKADRAERAEKEKQKIRAELGDKVTRKPVKNELRQHAWRIARLNHLVTLAEARENADAVKQAQLLIEKENARHAKALATLKTLPPEADGKSGSATPAKPKAPTEKKEGASL